MGNLITNKSSGPESRLKIGNGSMSVLISALALSGSFIAEEQPEVELVIWLVSRDQGILGMGAVGFDLQNMPWAGSEAVFDQQKTFLLNVIQRIKAESDLSALSYNPKFLIKNIETFERMIGLFLFGHVNHDNALLWMPPTEKLRKCETHGVLLHEHGCVVCNDK